MKKIIVAITGASGAIYGIRTLQVMKEAEIESYLIISEVGKKVILAETDFTVEQVKELAAVNYENDEIDASIASGSFPILGMIVIPCSIKTLSGIANSYADDLITRAADVTLKEGRPLLLSVRESPLHRGHLRIMDLAAQAGAIIAPPVPAMYSRPASLDEMISQTVFRNLNRLGLDIPGGFEWGNRG